MDSFILFQRKMAQEVQFHKYPLQTLLLKKVIFIAQLQTINFYFLLFARTINPSLSSTAVYTPHLSSILGPISPAGVPSNLPAASSLQPITGEYCGHRTNQRGVLWSRDQLSSNHSSPGQRGGVQWPPVAHPVAVSEVAKLPVCREKYLETRKNI